MQPQYSGTLIYPARGCKTVTLTFSTFSILPVSVSNFFTVVHNSGVANHQLIRIHTVLRMSPKSLERVISWVHSNLFDLHVYFSESNSFHHMSCRIRIPNAVPQSLTAQAFRTDHWADQIIVHTSSFVGLIAMALTTAVQSIWNMVGLLMNFNSASNGLF